MRLHDTLARLVAFVRAVVAGQLVLAYCGWHHIRLPPERLLVVIAAAWVAYRLLWRLLTKLRRCPIGCGARFYYRLPRCPGCLAPNGRYAELSVAEAPEEHLA
jgi:hypothetical protein